MNQNSLIMKDKGEIIVYQSENTLQLEVRMENETVWLTQAQMVELFQRDRTVITKHINNVFREGELDKESNVHFLHIANSDKPIMLYSLDVIISVGYRVNTIGYKRYTATFIITLLPIISFHPIMSITRSVL
ncbi:hypothetical protein CE91St1_39110 [Parabacteroides goldsteinii]|nr:hypothetical protein CE91St1_39110 [Parabacteroides goldsteinii]GKG81826.1 hypothetical protein CE91St2_50180 [Parabacteroides goldsteinii]